MIIGAIVGLVVVAFILLTENLGSRLYPAGGAAWRRVLIPLAGALSTGYLLARYFPDARGSGIPQTKTALFVRDGYIAVRTVLGKFGMSAVSLASGIALGREGPSVQVGAGIASVLGRRLGLSPASVKGLVPVGASAALAAAFNTPIAAVLFSLEEVMGDMNAPVLGSIVLGSATSWIVLHLLLGDEPLFHVPAYQLVHPVEFFWYAVLGLAGGLMSAAFVKLLLWQRKQFFRMPKGTVPFRPAVGGLVVGLLGWFVPPVLGVGYGYVGQALNGQMVIRTMALLVALKIVATATCYASGNAGGIFGPSLYMGAMAGGAVGGIAHMLMPDYTGSAGAYALVGMGTAFAGIVRVPLTSVIMIFEMTRDYSIIVPLMISNLVAYFVSSQLQEEPIYEALLHQDGIHLPHGARARAALVMVGNAFRPAPHVLSASEPLEKAASTVERDVDAWPVVDANGLAGMVTATQIEDAIASGFGDEPVGSLVAEPASPDSLSAAVFPHVHTDHPLEVAVQRLAQSGLPVLPVVSRTNVRELKGTISMDDILAAYRLGTVTPETAGPDVVKGLRRFPPLAAALGGLIALLIVAGFVNYFYRAGRVARAEEAYRTGNAFMKQSRYPEAVESFRNAVSISPNPNRRLALGMALAKEEQWGEAAVYLDEVVREQRDSGPAHLALAEIAAKEGRIDAAALEFRRAVDGTWPEKADESRVQARMELVQMLSNAGQRSRAEAELLALAAEAPRQPPLLKRVALMLNTDGLPKQAGALYREVLRRNPRDADALDGLAGAEFAQGDYREAKEAWTKALRIDPTDAAAVKGIDAAEQNLKPAVVATPPRKSRRRR
ncbi:MAG: chloride channel protein [Acidobacteriia bacterium]|nr:chloride channel protein [Terriglobia bacterium]